MSFLFTLKGPRGLIRLLIHLFKYEIVENWSWLQRFKAMAHSYKETGKVIILKLIMLWWINFLMFGRIEFLCWWLGPWCDWPLINVTIQSYCGHTYNKTFFGKFIWNSFDSFFLAFYSLHDFVDKSNKFNINWKTLC
jgi:hypothetical protein